MAISTTCLPQPEGLAHGRERRQYQLGAIALPKPPAHRDKENMRSSRRTAIIGDVTRMGLISRALLTAAVAIAIGHLAAVTDYQRDRLVELSGKLPEPALVEHWHYQSIVEQRTLRIAEDLILLCAVAAAARSIAEAALLLLTAVALAGLTAGAEMWALRYQTLPWPLVPVEVPAPVRSIVTAHTIALLLAVLIYSSTWRQSAEPARHRRASRQRPQRQARQTKRRPPRRQPPPETAPDQPVPRPFQPDLDDDEDQH